MIEEEDKFKGLLYSPEVLGGIGLLTAGLSGSAPSAALPSLLQGMQTSSLFKKQKAADEKQKLIDQYEDQVPENMKPAFKIAPFKYLEKYVFNKQNKIETKQLMIPDENGKYNTPKTFNLSLPSDVVAFNKFKDQKGVYEVKPPGVVSSSFDGMKTVSKSAKSKWESEIKGQEDLLANLNRMENFYDERFLQIQGKADKALQSTLDRFGFATEEKQQFLQRYANWEQAQEQYFNAYRKLITGVAAGEKEIAWIQASIPSSKDSPSVYRSKVQLQKQITKQIIDRAKRFKGGFEKAIKSDGTPTKEFQAFLKKEGLNPSYDIVSSTHDLYFNQGYDEKTMKKIMNQNFEGINWEEILGIKNQGSS